LEFSKHETKEQKGEGDKREGMEILSEAKRFLKAGSEIPTGF
jgi:hypothetical protein